MSAAEERQATGRKGNGQFDNGNGGRRKGSRNKVGKAGLTAALRALVDPQEIAQALITACRGGDVSALKYVYDRLEGQPAKTLTLAGNAAKPIHVHHDGRSWPAPA
jgi:hypothetical protein